MSQTATKFSAMGLMSALKLNYYYQEIRKKLNLNFSNVRYAIKEGKDIGSVVNKPELGVQER